MSDKHCYDESVSSKWEDIRRDGPGSYTSILEISDNSIDWGKCNNIEFIYDKDRGIFIAKDNGPNGFGKINALHRFFTLGEKNEDVKETTIGKFGKGGYKACINISNNLEVISYFDNKGHCIKTDFVDMEKNNNLRPTNDYHETKRGDEIGSQFTLQFRPNFQNIFNIEQLTRHINRAYHDYDKKLTFKINGKDIVPSGYSPYGNYTNKEVHTVYYDYDTNKFTSELFNDQLDEDIDEDMNEVSVNKNRVKVGVIELYVLKDLLKNIDLLGDHPGIDIYRNNRLCNTKNPLTGIGNIGTLLSQGGYRGNRCHMVFRYKNVKISENLEMDNQLGLSTWKEIADDAKEFAKTLLNIILDKARRCNQLYEKLIYDQKARHTEQIVNDHAIIRNLFKLTDTELVKDKTDLNQMKIKYINLLEFRACYFDDEELKFKYCTSKSEATKMKKDKMAEVIKTNSDIYIKSKLLFNDLDKLIKKQISSKKNEKRIKKVQTEKKVDRNKAIKFIENEDNIKEVKKKISEVSKCDNIEEQKNKLLDAKKVSIDDEELSVELDKKLEEVNKNYDEQKTKEEEAEKQRALEEEEAEKQRTLEEEEAKKQRALEEEEAKKQRVLEEEEKKEKYKHVLKNIQDQDNDIIHKIIEDWLKKQDGEYKNSMNIVKLMAKSLL